MATYMQYVRRDLKIGDIEQGEELAWNGPIGLGSNRHLTTEKKPKPGDHIYLVSSLGGSSPPSLDALIMVTKDNPSYPGRLVALRKVKEHVYAAGKGSCWYPMLDATELFEGLRGGRGSAIGDILGVKKDKNGKELSPPQRLQGARTIRSLVPDSILDIRAWVDKNLRHPVFISYRSTTGKKLASQVANYLATHGIPIWYDQWSISIRLDEIGKNNAEGQLNKNIRRELCACSVIVKVETEGYGESPWTKKEQKWSKGLNVVSLRSGTSENLIELVREIDVFREKTSNV